jgi:hypothetical protein
VENRGCVGRRGDASIFIRRRRTSVEKRATRRERVNGRRRVIREPEIAVESISKFK